MKATVIRPATEGDSRAIEDLRRRSGLLVPRPVCQVVVAEDDSGQVVAFASFYVDGQQAVGMEIANLGDPGLGRALAEACFAKAKEMGATFGLAVCRPELVRWHLSLGYRVIGYCGPGYYSDGGEAVIMRRDL